MNMVVLIARDNFCGTHGQFIWQPETIFVASYSGCGFWRLCFTHSLQDKCSYLEDHLGVV